MEQASCPACPKLNRLTSDRNAKRPFPHPVQARKNGRFPPHNRDRYKKAAPLRNGQVVAVSGDTVLPTKEATRPKAACGIINASPWPVSAGFWVRQRSSVFALGLCCV